jgi:putative peptidoglycan lipid II flippase
MGLLQWQLATRLDWIALGAHEIQRALFMAGSLAASAVVYFAVLLLVGMRPRALGRPS